MTPIVIRAGLPIPGGALLQGARYRKIPVLVSANAFARRKNREFVHFALPPQGRFADLDVALDSAGFVAMSLYRGYEWSVAKYFDLVEAADWAWYAAMDLCCEPEVANSANERRLRVAATAQLYGLCRNEAQRRILPPPMPVLQGWTPDDYRRCVDLMPIAEWPLMVGIGSVCRREVHGPAGILAVVDALDRVLPAGIGLHLFGVKSLALQHLASHPRVVSTDSMAWDFALRMKQPVGRTQGSRIEAMHAWHLKQQRIANREAHQFDRRVTSPGEGCAQSSDVESDELSWEELIASGEIDYESGMFHAARDSAYGLT